MPTARFSFFAVYLIYIGMNHFFDFFVKFLYEKFGETNINHYLCTRKSETKSHNAKCGCDAIQTIGEMAEWSNAPVLKTGVLRGTGGSNPSLSAKISVTSYKTTSCADFSFKGAPNLRQNFSGN